MKSLTIICLFLASFFTLQAQTFGAAIVAGVNASQISGDDRAGYSKLGLHAGVRGIWHSSEQTDLSIGIQYSQRGSNQKLIKNSSTPIFNISTDFIDVPLVFYFKDWLIQDDGFEDYYKLHFHGGLSYNRLIEATAVETAYDELTELFNENQISFLLGATFFITEHIGVTARFNQNFNLLFNKDKVTQEISSLRPFWLNLRLEYSF